MIGQGLLWLFSNIFKIVSNIKETKMPSKIPSDNVIERKQEVAISPKVENPGPTNNGFLIFPIQGNYTANTGKVSAIIDHSGTPIDQNFQGTKWYQDNGEVRAFNNEVGNFTKFKEEKGAGFSQQSGEPFLVKENINYVGVSSQGGNKYLQYDSHSGYDFRYGKGTTIVAPAEGDLFKAHDDRSINGGINGNNTGWYKKNFSKNNCTAWEGWHSFYIKHLNGYSTWFLHCEKLEDRIENQIRLDYTKSVHVKRGEPVATVGTYGFSYDNYHLHFEVRKDGRIVDPYLDKLWLA